MTPRRTLRIAAFACATGLAAAACGGASSDEAVEQAAPEATTAIESAPADIDGATDTGAVVPASLQFTAPLVGGGEIVGDELAGKPTAFWFWSPT